MANPDNTGKIGSVTMGIGQRIIHGEIPELFYSNGQIVYKIKDKDDLILLLDPKTGIVRDVATGFCGAYCYHDQITNSRIELAENLISGNPNVWPEFIGIIASTAIKSSESAPSFIESFTAEGVSVELAGAFIGPVLLDGMVLAVIENNRPELVADAEENGLFNLADYYRNNNALELQIDVMYQAIGRGGPPQGIFDESNQYIQNNPNVWRNQQDIQSLKDSARALWDALWGVILETADDELDDEQTTLDDFKFQQMIDNMGVGGASGGPDEWAEVIKNICINIKNNIVDVYKGIQAGDPVAIAKGAGGVGIGVFLLSVVIRGISFDIIEESYQKYINYTGNNSTSGGSGGGG